MDPTTPAGRGRRDRRRTPWRTAFAQATTQLGEALLRAGGSRRSHRTPPDEPPDEAADRPAPRSPEDVITHCAAYLDDRHAGPVSVEAAAALARDGTGYVWVDLADPTDAEITDVAATFDLPELAVEDAVQAHQRPKLEVYEDTLFVVLKPVVYIDPDEVVEISEIALFVGPRSLVTVRHGQVPTLDRVREELEADQLPVPGTIGVLHRIADLVVDGYESAISAIDADVDEIEVQVFTNAQDAADDHSERIYKLKREIAEFRRAVGPLAIPLQRLTDAAVPGITPRAQPFFRDVHDHATRAYEAIEAHDRLLSDVLQADFARLAARQSQISVQQNEIAVRQNQDMRKISAWAAIGLVPTAIAGIYGMNFVNIPEIHWYYGYYGVLVVMAVLCFALYRAFRRNGWL